MKCIVYTDLTEVYPMLFSELYSAYYNTVAQILSAAVTGGTLSEKQLQEFVLQNAFSESVLTILPALRSGKWQLLRADRSTPIKNKPAMPLTTLQKRWLKAILLDRRIKLFDIRIPALADTDPLFTPEDYIVFDQYADGDDFEDAVYIRNFRTILNALRERYPLHIQMRSRSGQRVELNAMPESLEYSEKDDKFRLLTSGCRYGATINLARMLTCEKYFGNWEQTEIKCPPVSRQLVLELTDERNALERALLHFAHFEKRAECIGPDRYRITICYDLQDELEMVIRVLSFGPLLKVTGPEEFAGLIRDRLIKQKAFAL